MKFMLSYSVDQCRMTGILDFAETYSSTRKLHLVLKDYWGGDDADNNVLYQRASALNMC